METRKINMVPLLPHSIFGLFLGGYILIACSLSTAWNIMLVAGLLTLFVALLSKDWLQLSIFFIGLSLPLGFSKGLVTDKGVYEPAFLIQLSDFFIIGALFIWGWRIIIKKKPPPLWNKYHTVAFILIVWFALTIIKAPDIAWGFFEWLTLLKSFLFYLLISDYFTEKKNIKIILYALLLSVILQIIIATAQQILQDPLIVQGMKGMEKSFGLVGFEIFRPRGTLEHPNGLSSFLLYSQPIIFSVAYFYLKGIKKILFFIIFLLSVIIHVWTYSRIGWFSMVCEAIIFIFVLFLKGRLTMKNITILILCAFFIFGTLGFYHGKILDRLFGYDNMSTKFRRVMEQISIQLFLENKITGAGFGNYAPASVGIYPENFALIGKEGVNSIAGKHYVHNGYLLLLSETGIIGIIVWVTFFGNILLCGYRNIIKSKDNFHLALSTGVFLSLSGLFVNMSLEHFRNNMLTLIMWMCAGIILALNKWEPTKI